MTANWLKKVGYIHMMKHYTVLKITFKKKKCNVGKCLLYKVKEEKRTPNVS